MPAPDAQQLDDLDQPVADIQERHEAELLALPNVVGVGVGRRVRDGIATGEPCLTVFVTRRSHGAPLGDSDQVPAELEHCRTDVVELRGEFGASEPTETETQSPGAGLGRLRPAPGGCSVGGSQGGCGSLATAVIARGECPGVPTQYFALSSNSALAGCNAARPGAPVLQPALQDGGRPDTSALGRLARFVPLRFDGELNLVDAALAEVPFAGLDRRLVWIGHPGGDSRPPLIGGILRKSGRRTGFTRGQVIAVNASVAVEYACGRALFSRQVVSSPMSAPGDSGALVVDADSRPVGLSLAAAPNASVLSPIAFVERLLDIQVSL